MAQDGAHPLRFEFVMDMEVSPWPEDRPPDLIADTEARLAAEAAWVFAAMVWGFEFEYTPSDRARGVAERFVLGAAGSVAPGDPRLKLGESRSEGMALRAYADYLPDEAAALAMRQYDSWVRSQGSGRAAPLGAEGARLKAAEDAIRDAIRSAARDVSANKPRLVSGRVVLERPPSIVPATGGYSATVAIRVEITDVLPYVVF
jgi:hypothetical protein